MSGVVVGYNGQRFAKYPVFAGAGTYLTTVAGNASANAKGVYTELIASTPFWSKALALMAGPDPARDGLLDLAIGAAASEQIIVNNRLCSSSVGFRTERNRLPLQIPDGVRVAARCQLSTGTQNCYVATELLTGGPLQRSGLQRTETYGAATADSGGTSIDPGASADTKGAYVQLIASTAFPIHYLIICIGGQLNAVRTGAAWNVDIAIGAATSESVIVPDLWIHADSVNDFMLPAFAEWEVEIPAGSRIAVRAECQTNDATDRLFDIVLIGVG